MQRTPEKSAPETEHLLRFLLRGRVFLLPTFGFGSALAKIAPVSFFAIVPSRSLQHKRACLGARCAAVTADPLGVSI
jgi:hypothetical protein